MDSKKINYKINSFVIEYDCSSSNDVKLPNGTEPIKSGNRIFSLETYITIKNNNSEDIFVKAINDVTNKAVRSVYVRSNMEATIKGLALGTYYLAVAYGSHWDNRRNNFRCDKTFAIFNDEKDLLPISQYGYVGWKMTLYQYRTNSFQNYKEINETTFQNY